MPRILGEISLPYILLAKYKFLMNYISVNIFIFNTSLSFNIRLIFILHVFIWWFPKVDKIRHICNQGLFPGYFIVPLVQPFNMSGVVLKYTSYYLLYVKFFISFNASFTLELTYADLWSQITININCYGLRLHLKFEIYRNPNKYYMNPLNTNPQSNMTKY